MSLSLALKSAYSVDPGTILTLTPDGGVTGIIDGDSQNGFFLKEGTLTIRNATLQNFNTVGGEGSGGGAGLGGALFINTGATVILDNVNILSNSAVGGKGGFGDKGGTLNNLFTGSLGTSGADGTTPNQTAWTDIGGTTGTKGYSGISSTTGFGGAGGDGGSGGNGGDKSETLILATTTAALDIVSTGTELAGAAGNPFTINIALTKVLPVINSAINLANAIITLAAFDQSLADGQIGLGGSGGKGGDGAASGFGFGGAPGGAGGDGGKGGQNWILSAFWGGAAGGDAGDGGSGGIGGFGAGGGKGGDGGIGGAGASWEARELQLGIPDEKEIKVIPAVYSKGYNFDHDNNPSTPDKWVELETNLQSPPASYSFDHDSNNMTPDVTVVSKTVSEETTQEIVTKVGTQTLEAGPAGSRPDGLDGAGGAGGLGGFGGGAGEQGATKGSVAAGGRGGNGQGGGIFVRAGGNLTITGNAVFDGNGVRGGDGQAAGENSLAGSSGIGIGSDLYMMKGSTVILDPDKTSTGNVITFNGSPYSTSIADDSASSMIPGGGASIIPSGAGAGITIKSGLVQFNGNNVYSGQTTIEGGTLQANDGEGIYWDSNINFKGTTTSNAVLMGNGDFTRFVGAQSNRVQWEGSGGFAASGGELNVRLSNGQTMKWANPSSNFVKDGNALVFGSKYATDVVNFQNNIDLNGAERTILVTANDATLSGAEANTDFAVLNGILSNGSLTIGDATHTGIVVLGGKNTYTGATKVNGGGLALSGGGTLNSGTAVNLASGTSFDISGINGSSQTIASLTAASNTKVVLGAKNLTTGDGTSTAVAAVISGDGGSLTKQGSGTMTLSAANTYTGATLVKAGTLETSGNERLADATNVTVESGATFRLGGTEAVGTIAGAGAFNLQGNALTTNADTNTTVSGVISGSGGSLVKNGMAKLTLTGANTFSGATTINDVTVALKDGGSLSDSTALSITAATGVFDISAKTDSSETVASISSIADSSVVLGAKNLTAGDSNDTTVAGTISGTGGSFTKTGSGTTTFTGANTYTGATTITDGTLALSAGGSLSDLSAVNISSATGVLDISGITASSETIASIAGISGSKVFLGAKNLTAGDSSNTTMAGVISDGGIAGGTGGSLTKQGTGKLTLSGANTYTGDTTVNAGTLETSGNERIANASDLIVASGATFLLGGFESLSSISGAGSINLQSNTLVTDSNVDTTFSGVISGTDSSVLTKTGTGKLTLSGANTYTGTTNFNGGSADLTGSLESKFVNVAAGVILDSKTGGLSSAADLSNDGTINLGSTDDTVKTYTSTGTLNGPGTLTALNYNLNGGSVVNANLGTGTITTNGTVDLYGTSAAATIVINAASVLNLKGPELILNTASVTVNGTLNLDYTPAGTETFQTLLGSGTIHTNGNSIIVADGGNFTGILDAAGSTLTTGGGSGGGGGGGGLTLGGGTTTTQSTNIESGLTIGSGATLNSNTITIANGSTLDLSGGGTIIFTTLTSLDATGGIINIGSNDFIVPVGSTIAGNIKFIGTGNVIILGTIAPGFSPGVTDLTGAGVSPVFGGAFKAELAGLGGVGGTDLDQIQLAPGATLTISNALNVATFAGFTAVQGNQFQIISGPGGAVPINHLTGTFSTVTFDADGILGLNPAVTNAAVVFDVNTGALTATGLNAPTSTFADLGGNDNQRAAAASIFNAAFVGQNQIDSSTTAGRLALQITDATGGSAADLAKYTPDYYGSLADYAFMGNQVLARSIQDRVSPMNYIPSQIDEDSLSQVPETMSVFMGYTYANLNTADSARATRSDYYAGVNLLASEDYVFGIAGSMSQGSISAALGSANSDGWGAMVFGRYTLAKSFTLFGSFGLNQQNMDVRRQTVNGTVTGSTDVASYVGFLGVQYKGWRVGGVSIAPRVSLSYSNSRVGGFSETGAIDALNVGGYHNNRFMGEAGLSALWSTDIAGHGLNLELAASVQQYFQNTKSQMGVNVASVPSASYGVNFAKMGSTQAVVQFNAGYELFKAVTSYVGYEGHFGNQSTQYAKAGIRVNF